MSNREHLQDEVSEAKYANTAYTAYLKNHFEEERLVIFNRFCNADIEPDTLLNIKHEQMALDNLEQVTLAKIETGRLAGIMLADLQE